MKSPYVSELEAGKVVVGTFLVHSKEVRQKKSGEPYLSLGLGDRTGELEAKMWDNVVEVMDTFERDDFVKVKGLLQIYNNRPQLTIHKMQRVPDGEVDLADYLPASRRDPDEMLAELRGIIAGMSNPHLRALVELFLDDEDIAARYKKAPAAKLIHHAYLGGLIEHVLSLCHLCRLAAQHYRTVDLDLLLAGAVLHDVGKIYELTYDRSFGYSSEGQLVGHIVIGLRLIERKLVHLPHFPARLRTLVEHLVLSHHGQLEFGSPKLPQFREALLLYYLDDLDAKMDHIRAMVEQDRQVEGHWTGYSTSLERVVLKKLKYLADEEREDSGALLGTPSEDSPPPRKPAPAEAPKHREAARRDDRTPSLFGEKLGQALENRREDK